MIYLVTSTKAHQGKTTFAVKLAQQIENSVLIDTDIRGSKVNRLKHAGWFDYINKKCKFSDIFYYGNSFTYIYPATHILAFLTGKEIFDNKKFDTFIKEVSNFYQNLIIDTSPLLVCNDTQYIIPFCNKIYFIQNNSFDFDQELLQHKEFEIINNSFIYDRSQKNLLEKEFNL